nr:ATP synthase F0 subunit 8 [Acanthosoma labiduroides]
MPQMSPLWWEILFLMFITAAMLMMTIIYHNKNIYKYNMKESMNKNYQMKWKW